MKIQYKKYIKKLLILLIIMSLKINRSQTKTGVGTQKKKSKKSDNDSGLFSKLLGISSSSPINSTENAEFTEVNSLSSIISIEDKKELNKLINKIDEAGKLFAEKPLYPNLVKYKLLIQNFMAIIIKSSYEVQQKLGKKSIIEDKVYSIVKKVDSSLEELSEKVLNEQIDNIKLIDKLDEIRGILIDLYK